MKAEDFAAWLAAISGMSLAQRAEAFATLEEAGSGGAEAVAESSGQGPGKGRRREDALGTASLSVSRLRGVLIARDARSSVGAARTGCCGSAARVAGAPSMR